MSYPSRICNSPDGSIRIHAPAKLNFGLRIFPKRSDGFHDLESWFVPISLYDTLIISPAEKISLTLTGDAAGLSEDTKINLAGRAALALAESTGINRGAAIRLHKLIPHGGGLGGGSSDAAATLVALNVFWQTGKNIEELEILGSSLGSDVPFFIRATSAVCRGRGELITPLPLRRFHYAVLVIPPQGTSTKLVYEKFDEQIQRDMSKTSSPLNYEELSGAETDIISEKIVNDLEPPAFVIAPWLKALQHEIDQTIHRHVHMSGSGSTLFVLCGSGRQSEELVAQLTKQFSNRCKILPVMIYPSGKGPGMD
ncbi:MAG TPA: 4-(cytidine 5'-diphospho)-2-C-methyl-D-erythritol kinase [Phycisphaerae bacterium]|nr:4-(cytidine 5'-diphospho)-2-C-methyl-D-erythritol kinase [Phycisphaerae bacterium]